MHNSEKYPEIWAAKERAEKELAPLLKKRQKHMADVDAASKEMDALREKKNAAHEKACADMGRMVELKREISRMAKAMGARQV